MGVVGVARRDVADHDTVEPDADFRGPGGAYAFEVTRAGAALADAFWGILGGLDPVEDLDELVS